MNWAYLTKKCYIFIFVHNMNWKFSMMFFIDVPLKGIWISPLILIIFTVVISYPLCAGCFLFLFWSIPQTGDIRDTGFFLLPNVQGRFHSNSKKLDVNFMFKMPTFLMIKENILLWDTHRKLCKNLYTRLNVAKEFNCWRKRENSDSRSNRYNLHK